MKDSGSELPTPVPARDPWVAQIKVERRLRQRLRIREINGAKFRRQHPINSYIVDCYKPKNYQVILSVKRRDDVTVV
jgi:very-short-patch-repair endonuclease